MWNWHDYLRTNSTCSTNYSGASDTPTTYIYLSDICYTDFQIVSEPEPEIFFDPKNLW